MFYVLVNVIIMAIVPPYGRQSIKKQLTYMEDLQLATSINAPVLFETYSTYTCRQLHLLQVRLILADHKSSYNYMFLPALLVTVY